MNKQRKTQILSIYENTQKIKGNPQSRNGVIFVDDSDTV